MPGSYPPGHVTPFAYLELHVEQGPVLDHEKVQIGAVTGVQGIFWQNVTVEGAANHAGTTPTALRHDAGLAAARAGLFLRELAVRSGTLATVGSLRLEPGLINVVPGKAVFSVDMRDPDADRLAAAQAEFAAFLPRLEQEEGVRVSSRVLVNFAPVAFAPGRDRQGGSRRAATGLFLPAHGVRRGTRRPDDGPYLPHRHDFCPQSGRSEPLPAGIHRAGRFAARRADPAGNGSGSAGCGRYRHKMSVASGAEPVFSKIWKDGLRSRSEQKRRYAEATGQIR